MEKETTNYPEYSLGKYQQSINKKLITLEQENFGLRFWRKDHTLWKDDAETKKFVENSMGWLHVAEKMTDHVNGINQFVNEVKLSGIKHVVLIGMGGSSLAPLVLQKSFMQSEPDFSFSVLDSTDPETIIAVEDLVDLNKTLFIIASKSGSTAEISALFDHFFHKVSAIKNNPGENFCAITDPGTAMVDIALKFNFRQIFRNYPDIGGRYSALSFFGLVPAAFLGLDIKLLLDRALQMIRSCSSHVPVSKNPGISLGVILGELAVDGRDKVTFIIDEPIATFGLWLEQLIAESTGKEGKGILPVEGEKAGIEVYGEDRVLVYFQNSSKPAGLLINDERFPTITIWYNDVYDLGAEFFRWEIATATASAILGINPFDQPNVQENKEVTAALLKSLEAEKKDPVQKIVNVGSKSNIRFNAPGNSTDEDDILKGLLSNISGGGFIAIHAYISENPKTEGLLQEIRGILSSKYSVPVTIGYGPRFLHSTGQFHKGGTDKGIFIQLTCTHPNDLAIAGRSYTFGDFKLAQAQGDYEVLCKKNRKVISVDLGHDIPTGLNILKQSIDIASGRNFLKTA